MLAETAAEEVGHFDDLGPTASGPARRPRIPPGDEYEARSVGARRKAFRFGSKTEVIKFVLSLQIVQGPHAGTTVEFIKPLRGGRSSDYRRAWTLAAGREPARDDRMPMTVFRHHLFRILVDDVTTDSRGHPLAPENRYSRVAALLEKIA